MSSIEGLTEARPDVFSLESLIAWLEKQPAATLYDPYTPDVCMLGQFCKAMGNPLPFYQSAAMGRVAPFDDIALCGTPSFGAALTRARAAQASAVI